MLLPAAALATVQPFAAVAPGGSGTGGGAGEIWPIGFGFVTGQDGALWGETVGDTYQALTRDTTYISGTDPIGGPQRLLAFVNKNPSINAPYIKLRKNGVDVEGFDTHIQSPARNSVVVVPDYLSQYPILYPGAPQNNAWYIPINGLVLDPGCAYELRFLCGIKANNSMTGVIYTDTSDNKLGYIQYNGLQSYPDENDQYIAKQYDTYRFRNAGPEVLDENRRFEDFTFKFQTHSNVAAFTASLASAQSALTTATANSGSGPGQVSPARVAALQSVVDSAAGVPTQTMRERLQPAVDAAVAGLDAAVANAQIPNPPSATTSVTGIPSGWTTSSVTFSLESTGGHPPCTTFYALNGGSTNTYSVPVTVSDEGTTTLSYFTIDSIATQEPTNTAYVRIDRLPPVTSITGVTDGGLYGDPASFSLSADDPESGPGATYYSVDAGPETTYAGLSVSVPGIGQHTVTYRSVDAVGNGESTKTVTFRVASAPVTTMTGAPSGWATGTVTFSLDATGDAPPFATYYAINGGLLELYTLPVAVSADGTTTVSYYSVNALGVPEPTKTATIRIDTVAPATTISGLPSGPTLEAVTFSLSAADPTSGIANRYYTLDGGAQTAYSDPVVVGTSGAHTLTYWSADNAANTESAQTATFTVDPAWASLTSPTATALRSVFFIDRNTGWAVGDGGAWKTTDGGASWVAQSAGGGLNNVFFLDANNGFIAAYQGNPAPTVLKTSNGGATWSVTGSSPMQWRQSMQGVSFADTNNGWAVGTYRSASIQRTTNGGGSWVLQAPPVATNYYAVQAISANTAFAAGDSGTIIKTVDGGTTWTFQTMSGTNLRGLFFVDANTGWAVGTAGAIFKTTNAGATWTAQTSGTTNALNSVSFVDANVGCAVGAAGTILRTQDGGATWTRQAQTTTDDLTGIKMAERTTGFAVGLAGRMLKTAAPITQTSSIPTWSPTPVTFSFISTGLAAPNTTHYAFNGGADNVFSDPITVSDPGTTTVSYYSVGSSGQTEMARTALVRIDTLPPVTSITGVLDGGVYAEGTAFTLSATDAGSGVANIYYSLDGGADTTYTAPVEVSHPGPHILSWWATDAVGNVESQHLESFTLLPGVPLTTISGVPSAWVTSTVTFELESTRGVPPLTTYYSLNSGPRQTYSVPVPVDDEGTTTVGFRAVDSYGIGETTKTATIRIDRTPPTTTLSGVPTSGVAPGSVTLALSGSDPCAPVTNTYYTLDGGAQTTYSGHVGIGALGSHTLSYWSEDSAGNVEATHTTTFTIVSNWTAQSTGSSRAGADISFVDANVGWGTGGTTVVHTTDGGATWTTQANFAGPIMRGVQAIDANTAWVVGSSILAKTTDGGATWVTQTQPFPAGGWNYYISDICFVDANNGWVASRAGSIAHTTDGGATWTLQRSDPAGQDVLVRMYFADASNGWAVGYGGVWHTSDGGDHWVSQSSSPPLSALGLFAFDASNAWMVGQGGAVWHTTNGGTTWTQQATLPLGNIFGIQFTDANNGWVSGTSGVARTTDGGQTWVKELSGSFPALFVLDSNSVWAGVETGGVYKTTQPLTSATGIPAWANSPVTFSLTATDNTPPFSTYYKLGGGSFAPYTDPVTVSDLGTTTVSFYSVDAIGRTETTPKTANIRIETDAPVTTVDGIADGGTYTEPTTFTISATDTVSGVKNTYYSLDGGVETTYTGTTFRVIGMGPHTVSFWSKDNAGNVETTHVVNYVLLPSAPVTTLSTIPAWSTGPVTFSFATEQGEAPSTSYYAYNDGPTQVYSGPVTYSGEGTTTLSYFSVDVSGRTEDTKTATIHVDTVAPETTISGLPGDWPATGTVMFSLNATDLTSGVANRYYNLDGGGQTNYSGPNPISTPGNHTISYWSTDVAGNVEATKTATFRVAGALEWIPQTSGLGTNNARAVSFVDANTGFVVAGSQVAKTINAGATWTPQALTGTLYGASFVDANNGCVVGSSSTIRYTATGGTTWLTQTAPWTGTTLYGAKFTDSNNGWIVGSSGRIAHTTNGGGLWSSQTSPFGTSSVYGVCAVDANTAWAVGASGKIAHTTNGGDNWALQSSPTGALLYSVWFVDANNGWAAGASGTILHTINGGTDWTVQMSSGNNLQGIFFTDASNGWAVGASGTILRTTNGGATWASVPSGTTRTIYGVCFANTTSGWVAGASGTILTHLRPAVTTASGIPSWATAPVTFSLDATGSGTPFTTYYRLNGGAAASYTGPVTVSAEGTTTLQFYSTDSLGGIEVPQTALIRIDATTPPLTAISGVTEGCYKANPATFTLSAVDPGWGVANSFYRVDAGEVTTYAAAPVTVSGPGAHSVDYWSVDNTGNVEPTNTVNFTISAGPPTTSIFGVPSGWATGTVTFSLDATGDAPPITSSYAFGEGLLNIYSGSVSFSTEGTTVVSYLSVDSAGQREATQTATIQIDSTPPATAISGLPASGVTLDPVTFSLSAIDTLAGVAQTYYTLDGGASTPYSAPVAVSAVATHTVTYWSTDAAGNIEGAHTAAFNIVPEWALKTPITGGNTWTSTYFINGLTGWACGSGGAIVRTDDGGATWQTQSSGTTMQLNRVMFVDANNGWAAGAGGVIMHTANGGTTWTGQPSGTTQGLNDCYFTDTSNGWAVGQGSGGAPVIVHTADGGQTWAAQSSGVTGTLNGVWFVDSSTGWAVLNGKVIKTTDGGTTWTATSISGAPQLRKVTFTSATNGVIVGASGKIYRTVDGGTTWTNPTSGTTLQLNGVCFVSPAVGYAVGNSGALVKTTDGGATWRAQASGTSSTLNSVFMGDPLNGFVVGANTYVRTVQPATTASGIPSWATSVTFSLSPSGDAAPIATYYRFGSDPFGPYSGPVTVSNPGVTPLSFYSVDALGRTEATQTVPIRIDTAPPVTSIIGIADSGIYSQPATFTLLAVDSDSGVSATFYSLDGAAETTYTGQVSVTDTGLHTVSYWSGDNAGNAETANLASFTVLFGAPQTTVSGIPSTWTSGTVTFSLEATLGETPLTTFYALGEEAPQTYLGPVPVTAEGTTTLSYHSVDNAGRTESTKTATIRIDKTPPATTISGVPSGIASDTVGFTLAGNDPASGIRASYYSVNGGIDTTYTARVTLMTPGDYTVRYWSSDNVGNVEALKTVSFKIAEQWESLDPGTTGNFSHVDFFDANNGWASGSAGIYHTADGGATWTQQYAAAMHRVFMLDSKTAWAVGGTTILHTTDGGDTWTPQTSGTSQSLRGVCFVDSNTGWVVGGNSTALTTTDGGATWTPQNVTGASTTELGDVDFVDADNGWIVGGGGVYHTADGGATWSRSPINNGFPGMEMIDAHNGWVTGESPSVLWHTTDGVTWTMLSLAPAWQWLGVSFLDVNTGYLVSGDGGSNTWISKTTDGGATWTRQVSPPGTWLYGVDVVDPDTVYVVGVNGRILKRIQPHTTASGIPSGWTNAPVTFSLATGSSDAAPLATYCATGGGAFGPYSSPITVSDQGTTTVSYYSTDAAGRKETTKTATIQIDSVAPTTTSDAQASYTDTATIQLTAADGAGGSGVAHTYYRLDAGDQAEGSSITTSALGAHTLEFWSVDGAGNVETPHKTASFTVTPAAFTITASAGAGGSIAPSGAHSVVLGSDATFTVTPAIGYHIADVLVNGASVGAVDSYTFVNVTQDHTIAASFAIDTYTVAASAGAHGSISPSGVQTVDHGASSPLFILAADPGFYVADVLVDGVSLGAVSSFQFTNVTANHTIVVSFAAETFTITASAGAGGTIAPAGAQAVSAGEDATFTITPNAGYHIADVAVDGVSVGAVGSYTFSSVLADHTIAASFEADPVVSFTVTATAGAGGSISPSGAQTVDSGSNVSFSITPAAGFHVADVLVDGGSVGALINYTFVNVTADHTIAASFEADPVTTYTVTASAGANGSITPSGAQTVLSGASSPLFVVTPSAGYHIADVLVDGLSVGAVSSFQFTNVTANHTIAASFALDTFTITASAGAGGAIAPSGAQTVDIGSNATFTVTPAAGFHIADVAVDGVSAGAVGTYTFTGVTANHTIAATFAIDTFTITASAGANGAISPSGVRTVDSGDNAAFSMTANSGYHVADVLVDGVSVGALTNYTFTNVTADHTIAASFEADVVPTYTVTALAGAGGSITPSGAQTVSSGGSSPVFVITPAAGYHVTDVVVDGISLGERASFQFTNVTADHTISASFAADTFTITPSAGAGGSIAPSGATAVNSGADATFTITPNSGFHVTGVVVDGVSVGAVGSYTFMNVTADHTIAATFAADPPATFTITASAGAGGSITPSGARSVNSGTDASFAMTPESGYHVADVLVDGVSVGAVSTYTFTNVTANHTIAASFAITGPASTSITIKAGASSTYIGRTVRLDGLVTPSSMIGCNIVVYVMKPGKSYWTYSSNRTAYLWHGAANWMYPYYFKRGMARGYYKFKARCPAPGFASSAGYALSESRIIQVRVR